MMIIICVWLMELVLSKIVFKAVVADVEKTALSELTL